MPIFRIAVLALGLFPLAAAAQSLTPASGNFTVTLAGKPAGTASYSIARSASGYTSSANGNIHMDNLTLTFSKAETLSTQAELVADSLKGTVNGSEVTVDVQPSGNTFSVKIAANGQSYSSALTRHAHTVFLSDFDPGALEVLFALSRQGGEVWALIPKQTGLMLPVKIVPRTATIGTLNGKSISVQHLTITVATVNSEIYFSPQGLFLQQEIPVQGLAMIRNGFQLTANHPAAPPPGD